MLKSIIHSLRIFLDGVRGKDRQANRKLTRQLSAAQANYSYLLQNQNQLDQNYRTVLKERNHLELERDRIQLKCDRLTADRKQLSLQYNQLQLSFSQIEQDHIQIAADHRELEEQLAIARQRNREKNVEQENLRSTIKDLKSSIENLKKNNAGYVDMVSEDAKKHKLALKKKRDKITELLRERESLKAKLDRCLYLQSSEEVPLELNASTKEAALDGISPEVLSSLDLSSISIAVIGGHDTLHRYLSDKLQQDHGIRKNKIRTINDDHGWDSGNVKERIQNFDFIFIVTDYMSHKLGKPVIDLKNKEWFNGEIVRLDKKGNTTVLSTILSHVARYLK